MPRKDSYKVTIDQSAFDFIAGQSKKFQRQIVKKINALATNPRPAGCKKLQGRDNLYRIRSETFRIVYTISDKKISVYIITVGDRKSVYRKIK
jgi:mRNA interferase RelE/StbE